MEPQRKRNHLSYLVAKLWRFSESNRSKLSLAWTMFLAVGIVELFFPALIWARIMSEIQRNGITSGNLWTLFGLLALVAASNLAIWILHKPARQLECDNAFIARMNYRRHLLQGVLTLPLGWHAEHHSGDTIDKIEKGTGSLYQFAEMTFEPFYSLICFAGSYAMLIYLSPPSAFIVAGITCVAVWITMRFDRVLVSQYEELSLAENKVSQKVYDAVSNITTVIILRVERLVFQAIMAAVEKPFALYRKNVRRNETKWFLTSMCSSAMIIVTLGVYLWRNQGTAQAVSLGTVYLVIQYLRNISELFFRFAYMYGDVVKRRAKVANAEVLAADFRSGNFVNHVLPTDWQEVRIEDLGFSYGGTEGGKATGLKDIALTIRRGERIAFVGESGSGKTTLMKLIRGLFAPSGLSLTVDGRSVAEGFEGIARAITLVPQSPEIFATTIRENITLGADHDEATIRRYTDMACFTEIADSLPKKLDSSIKEKGVNLSGGEQQRLALSRGLLACDDKEIVLLDEPTSNLDAGNELKIYENIFRAFRGKTIVSSVHRLQLLPLFDRICYFEDGCITASGSFSDLLARSSPFRELWRKHAKRHGEDPALSA